MAVNANSVIPVWLNTFNPDFYASLTSKEDWSYTNQGSAGWLPQFQALANALDTYRAYGARSDEVYDFMTQTYGYVILNKNFSTDGSLLSSLDALNIYSIGGFMATTISRPVNYYDDLAPPVPPETEYTSAKMSADVLTVTNAPEAETSAIAGVVAGTHSVIRSFTNASLWDDPTPVPTADQIGKPYMKNYYFVTLHWKATIQSLNINYPIPPGV